MSRLITGRRPFEAGRYITLFADASWCPHTKAYGWAYWVKHGDPAQTVLNGGGGSGMESAHFAEIRALEHGIAYIEGSIDLQGKIVVVQSDCTGALRDLTARIMGLEDKFRASRAYSKHVKGHRGHSTPRNSVNTTCDRLAKRHMRHFRQNIAINCKEQV